LASRGTGWEFRECRVAEDWLLFIYGMYLSSVCVCAFVRVPGTCVHMCTPVGRTMM